jgi:hypothetical protein
MAPRTPYINTKDEIAIDKYPLNLLEGNAVDISPCNFHSWHWSFCLGRNDVNAKVPIILMAKIIHV